MPFGRMHSARQKDPGGATCRIVKNKLGAGVHGVFCRTGGGPMELQSVRFDAGRFTPEQARAWLKDHDMKTGLEVASGAREGHLLLEAGGRLTAVLIREGVSKNGNRWNKPILRRLAEMVSGVPLRLYDLSARADRSFMAHWRSLWERLPPAVRDLVPRSLPGADVGRLVSPRYVEDYGDGRAALVADVDGAPAFLQRMAEQAAAVGRHLGLSIVVNPEHVRGRQTAEGGIEPVEISSVDGFDVVSFPSAGGRLVPVLEALVEERMKNLVKRLLGLLAPEKRRALEKKAPEKVDSVKTLVEEHGPWVLEYLKALEVGGLEEAEKAEEIDNVETILESLYKVAPDPEKAKDKPKVKAKKKAAPVVEDEETDPPEDPPDGDPDQAQGDATMEAVNKRLKRQEEASARMLRSFSQQAIGRLLTEAALPKPLEEFARLHWEGVLEADGVIDEKEMQDFLAGLKKGIGGSQRAGGGIREGDVVHPGFRPEWDSGDKIIAALDAMLNGEPFGILGEGTSKIKVPAFRGIKESWQIITGDYLMEGMAFFARQRPGRIPGLMESVDFSANRLMTQYCSMKGMSLAEAVRTTASYPLLLADRMHKRMVREYGQQALPWEMISSPESVSDFKTWRADRWGEFPNLAIVAEDALYVEVTGYPTEEEVTYAVAKRGGLAYWSWEAIVNDDTRTFRLIPSKLARAAARTLNAKVWGLLLSNGVIYDTTALATVGHANLTSAQYSFAGIKTARRKMIQQKDIDNRESGRVVPRHLFCGPVKMDEVYDDLFSDGKPRLTDTNPVAGTARLSDSERLPNILRSKYGFDLTEVNEFDNVDDDQVWLTADPRETEMIIVAFLNGRREPELFIQDLDRVGSFFDRDRITTKIRHIYDAVVADFRPFQAFIP